MLYQGLNLGDKEGSQTGSQINKSLRGVLKQIAQKHGSA